MGYTHYRNVWVKPVAFFLFIIYKDGDEWYIVQKALSAEDNTLFDWKYLKTGEISSIRDIQQLEANCGRDLNYWGDNPNTDILVTPLYNAILTGSVI